MGVVVPAPPLRAPRYGLLVTAGVTPAEAGMDPHWGLSDGVTWTPERIGGGTRKALDCLGAVASIGAGDRVLGAVNAEPFVVATKDLCSTFGFAVSDLPRRVRDRLAAIASYEVAAELWSGSIISDTQRTLTSLLSDRVTTSAVTASEALALLDQALAVGTKGQRGMVHCTPQVLDALVVNGAVRREGNLWLSPMDTVVVADGGYAGTGPGGLPVTSTQYVYATNMLRVVVGPTITLPTGIDAGGPDAAPDAWAQAVSIDNNDLEVAAMAPYLVQWDAQAHYAAEVNLALPALGGAS